MIEHGGNLNRLAARANCPVSELLDFSTNLHPAGPPDGLFEVCFRALDELGPYPEPHAESLAALAAARWGLAPETVLFGNGSSELLSLLPAVWGGDRALVVTPGYLEYEASCRAAALPVAPFPLAEADDFQLDLDRLSASVRPGDLVILGNPGNPTGRVVPAAMLRALVARHPGARFLIDEAFADFSGETLLEAGPWPENLAVLRSLTKYYAVAGLRLGFVVGPASLVAALKERQAPWPVGAVAARAAEFLLTRPEEPDLLTPELRAEFRAGLEALGLKVFPSAANYLLLKSDMPLAAPLLQKQIAVRSCANYPGLSANYIRVAVRPREEQRRLLEAVRQLVAPGAPALLPPRRTPALMLQGTCSNAGKSVLAAGFCRVLLQDGFRVAPFKGQNMALNSFATPDGGEIGRAQAVQAEACRIDPDVRMNPVLLKPDSDLGSQVIVKGRAIGNLKVREYYRRKPEFWETVKECYDSLAAQYEVMVLEGAGSPGEVNLKRNDIVNMAMAGHAGAAVLLAGDIDRGGVYASFVGTYATLTYAERKLLAGFLVNKFRGDPTLLADAHAYVERMTGHPVLGVIDYLRDLGLPEEDSVNFSFIRPAPKLDRTLDLALIRFDHIANFTDFVPFELEPDVTVRKVENLRELGTPDIVVLPGSKNVAADLAALAAQGGRELLADLRRRGVHFIGICGGLQMLGRELRDPHGVESDVPVVRGLGFLDLVTVMELEKTVRQSRARRSDGTPLAGYELHHGRTESGDPALRLHRDEAGEVKGYETERIFGSYLHGVFDDDAFRRRYLDEVRGRLGWPPLGGGVTARYETEHALNRLADHLRARLDLPALYRRMGLA